MNVRRFDLVARSLAGDRLSRRSALGRLGRGGLAATLIGGAGLGRAGTVGADGHDELQGDRPGDGGGAASEAATDRFVVPEATRETLPASDPTTGGRLRWLTDYDRGLWLDAGAGWVGVGREVFDVRAFGAVGDGRTDDWAAFDAAIEAMRSPLEADSTSAAGRTLFVPRGTYRLAQTLVLNRSVRLLGADGEGQRGDSVLLFDPGIVGVLVEANEPTRTGPEGRRGEGATIERLRIEAPVSAAGGEAHGVWLQARATVRGCRVFGFAGDGIRVEAPASGETARADADGWEVDNCRVEGCGGTALHVVGASGGVCALLDAVANAGWGVSDATGGGNAFLRCRASGNGLGAYTSAGATNRSVFLGCGAAEDQPLSAFADGTIVVGGDFGVGYQGGNAWTADGSRVTLRGQAPGTGDAVPPTVPTLRLAAGVGQTQPHLRIADDGGRHLGQVDVSGRLFLGPLEPGAPVGGAAEAGRQLVQLSGDRSGRVGVRWSVAGEGFDGWVAQARAFRDPAGPDAPVGFGSGRLTFQTPDAAGGEIDTLTLREGRVGVGTPAPVAAAALEVASTTRGLLPPRMTREQRDAIPAPPAGLMVYDTTENRLAFHDGAGWRLVATLDEEQDGEAVGG